MTNDDDRLESINLLIKKRELIERNKNVDPAQFDENDKIEIKKINLELTLLSGKANIRKLTVEDQSQMTEMVNALDNINAKVYDTTAEAQAAWDTVVDENAAKGLISKLENLDENDRKQEIQKNRFLPFVLSMVLIHHLRYLNPIIVCLMS